MAAYINGKKVLSIVGGAGGVGIPEKIQKEVKQISTAQGEVQNYYSIEFTDSGKPIYKVVDNAAAEATTTEKELATKDDINYSNVDMIFRDTVSEDTTKELKEIEVGGDKWKIAGGGAGGSGGGIIDVETLPTENIDDKSIYRIADGCKVTPYMKDAAKIADQINESFKIIVCNELPETGDNIIDYFINGSTPFPIYYDISQDNFFFYAGENAYMLEFEPNTWNDATIFFTDGMNYGGTINNESEATAEETLYFIVENVYKYFNYKNGKWNELINSDSVKDYIPENHLYENYLRIFGSNTDITQFDFVYLSKYKFSDYQFETFGDFLNWVKENDYNSSDIYLPAYGVVNENNELKNITYIWIGIYDNAFTFEVGYDKQSYIKVNEEDFLNFEFQLNGTRKIF